MYKYCIAVLDEMTHAERDRRRLSWRLRLGLGEPEELEEEERELEEPERLEPEELDPLEEPELEPELLLDVELDLDLLLLLPVEALRRFLAFSRPLSLSPSLVPVFSLPLSLVFSSSFRFVGDGALKSER